MISILAQTSVSTPAVEWTYLWPLVMLALSGVLLVTVTSLAPSLRNSAFPAAWTSLTGLATLVVLFWVQGRLNEAGGLVPVVGTAMVSSGFVLFATGVVVLAVLLVPLVLDGYVAREGLRGPEWYVLLLMSASGAVILIGGQDLIVTFLGLEIMSISVYVLAAMNLRNRESQEAGFKYFVLGALSSAIFLYGIALTYGATGTTSIRRIADNIVVPNEAGLLAVEESSLLLVGMAFLFVGLAFKVSAVPFQTWTPDVYEGAPTPIVGFMASAVKVAGIAAFYQVFLVGFGIVSDDWRPLLAGVAVASVLVGSFAAVVQTRVKRMLAFSSITHAGFMLIGLHSAADTDADVALLGRSSIAFYLLSYSLLVIGTFGIVAALAGRSEDDVTLDSLRGMARRRPLASAALVVLLFGQAGIPFTSGFFAKFQVIAAAAAGEEYFLAGIAMLGSVVGAFLYLRIVVSLYLQDENDTDESGGDQATEDTSSADGLSAEVNPVGRAPIPAAAWLAIGACVVATLVLGVVPDVIGELIDNAVYAVGR